MPEGYRQLARAKLTGKSLSIVCKQLDAMNMLNVSWGLSIRFVNNPLFCVAAKLDDFKERELCVCHVGNVERPAIFSENLVDN